MTRSRTGQRSKLVASIRVLTAAATLAIIPIGTAANGAATGVLRVALTRWRFPAAVYRTVAVATAGEIYVLGGHDSAGGSNTVVYGLNPHTGRTSIAGSLALPTHGAAAALVAGRILVFGGASYAVHNTVQAFNPATRRTTVIGSMPGVRADTTAITVGRVTLLLGGYDGIGPQSAVWETSNGISFRVVANLPQPIRYPAVAALGNSIYVFGGLISGGEYNGEFTNDIQRVNLSNRSAAIVGHLPVPLAHAMASEMGGHLFLFGGSTPSTSSAQMLSFDPSSRIVSVVGKLPEPITDAAVATLGTTSYLLGGISRAPLASVVEIRLIGS